MLEYGAKIPGTEINKSELKLTFKNGATIRLLGAEQADSLRGIYLDGLVMDETALMSEEAWTNVLRPTLADRRGWLIMIGTPMGRANMFYQMWEHARLTPHWYQGHVQGQRNWHH